MLGRWWGASFFAKLGLPTETESESESESGNSNNPNVVTLNLALASTIPGGYEARIAWSDPLKLLNDIDFVGEVVCRSIMIRTDFMSF